MPPGVDINALIEMLMQVLTAPPEAPQGEIAGGSAPVGPPAFAKTEDPMQAQVAQLLQMLQMGQAANPQQAMNASAGAQGGMYGQMGGRPRGT